MSVYYDFTVGFKAKTLFGQFTFQHLYDMQSLGIVFAKWILFLPLFPPQALFSNGKVDWIEDQMTKRILIYWLKFCLEKVNEAKIESQANETAVSPEAVASRRGGDICSPPLSYCQGSSTKTIFFFFLCVTLCCWSLGSFALAQICQSADVPFQQVLLKRNCLLTSPSELMATFSFPQSHKHQNGSAGTCSLPDLKADNSVIHQMKSYSEIFFKKSGFEQKYKSLENSS